MANRDVDRDAWNDAELEEDDVPLSPAEERMMAESAEAIARGEYVTSDELRARLGLRSTR